MQLKIRNLYQMGNGSDITKSPVYGHARVPPNMDYVDKNLWPQEKGRYLKYWDRYSYAIDKYDLSLINFDLNYIRLTSRVSKLEEKPCHLESGATTMEKLNEILPKLYNCWSFFHIQLTVIFKF